MGRIDMFRVVTDISGLDGIGVSSTTQNCYDCHRQIRKQELASVRARYEGRGFIRCDKCREANEAYHELMRVMNRRRTA